MHTIRRLVAADVDALVPLKASVHALHVASRPDFFKPMKPDEVAAWLRERLADDDTDAWLAEEGGGPIGYILTARRERKETPFNLARRWCEIDEVVVEPSCRRRGVSRALIEHAAAHARDSGLDGVELTAWSFNQPAREAFARVGFQPMLGRYELT